MKEIAAYVLDGFIVGCMTLLVMTGHCELKDFFIVVSPIVAIRAWQTKNGGPPPGLGGSVAVFFVLALVGLVTNRNQS